MSAEDDEPEVSFTEEVVTESIDDREQVRYGVDFSVTVNSEHNFYAGNAQNLSAGGVFIATHIVSPPGTRFDVSIHLEDGQKGVVRCVGEARWVRPTSDDEENPPGIGIQFVEITEADKERIERFLARRGPLLVKGGSSSPPPESS